MDPLVQRIGQIHVSVTDLARSVAFYRDVLGLRFLFDVPGQNMAFLDCGGVRLYLAQAESREFEKPAAALLRGAVRAGGVRRRDRPRRTGDQRPARRVHRTDTTELWVAFIRDPDGVVVGLMAEVALR